ncbi:MAG: STAS domain-containing protein [Leptospiraceae bacterium]|nr:STAS domain-containing protein [Leptospiraceae bacterium]MCP5497586.1 STAS domain-containing protein [Leptospiraceae bacterium]
METLDFESDLIVAIDRIDSVNILRIKGSISITDQLKVEKITDTFISQNKNKIVFDLQQLRFIDSSGIGFFLKFYKQLKKHGGKMAFINLQPQVKNIMELALVNLLDELYFPTEEEAVDRLSY